MATTDDRLAEIRADAVVIATCAVTGQAHDVSDRVTSHPNPMVLAFALAELLGQVHHRWAHSVGMHPAKAERAWAEMLDDIEAARGGR